MRITPKQTNIIRTVLHKYFGKHSRIWLFGSQLNDTARGGDIDLYIEPETLSDDNPFLIQLAAKQALETQLRRAVDLIVKGKHETAFMRVAKMDGQGL